MISFPPPTQMLPSGGFAIPVGNAMMPEGIITGRPIRGSSDQRLLAPTRGLSQLATPFFASQAKLSIKQRQRVGPASHGCLRDHVWRLSRSYRYALHPPCICWAALAFLYLCPFHDQPYYIRGGDPAAGSPTATLLRLLPPCQAQVQARQ